MPSVSVVRATAAESCTNLDSFSLSRSGGTERVPSAMQVHRRRERKHAAVGERGHHQPAIVALTRRSGSRSQIKRDCAIFPRYSTSKHQRCMVDSGRKCWYISLRWPNVARNFKTGRLMSFDDILGSWSKGSHTLLELFGLDFARFQAALSNNKSWEKVLKTLAGRPSHAQHPQQSARGRE